MAFRTITSAQNETVKAVKALQGKKARGERGLFVVEGADMLQRARACGWRPVQLFLRQGAPEASWRGWAEDELAVSGAAMAAMSRQGNPPDVIGVFETRLTALPSAPAAGDVWIGLEDIRDPGNLGTIIRTAEAAGAAGIILIGQCCDPFSPECVRATTGSIFAVPPATASADEIGALGWPGEIVATAMAAREDYRRIYRGPVLLLMGSESGGLSPALLERATAKVRIPMAGGTESLNVAMAAGLMVYEIRRAELR